jgi:hypothetical protein
MTQTLLFEQALPVYMKICDRASSFQGLRVNGIIVEGTVSLVVTVRLNETVAAMVTAIHKAYFPGILRAKHVEAVHYNEEVQYKGVEEEALDMSLNGI